MNVLKKFLAVLTALSMIVVAPASVMAAVTEVCNIEFDSDYQIGTDAITDSGSGTGGIWQGTADDVAYTEELVSGIGGKASDDYSWKVSLAGTATQNFHYRVGINSGTYLNANGYARFTADIYTNRFESFVIMMGSQNALQISTSSDGAVVVRIAGTEVENPVIPALNTWNTYEIVVYDADGNKGTAEAQVVSAYVNGELIGTVTSTNTASFRYFGIKPHANGKKVDIAPDNPLVVMMDNLKVERNNSNFASDYAFTIAGEASAATVCDVQRTVSYTGASVEELISALNADFDYEAVDENGALTDNLDQVEFLRVYDGGRCVAIYTVTADTVEPEPETQKIENDFNDSDDIGEANGITGIPAYFTSTGMAGDIDSTTGTVETEEYSYLARSIEYGVYGKTDADGAYKFAYNGTPLDADAKSATLRLQLSSNSVPFTEGKYAYLSFETAREGNDAGLRVEIGGVNTSNNGYPVRYLPTGLEAGNANLDTFSAQKAWDKVEVVFYDVTDGLIKYDVYINGHEAAKGIEMTATFDKIGHIRFFMFPASGTLNAGSVYLDNVIFELSDEKPVVSADYDITSAMASLGLETDEFGRNITSGDAKLINQVTAGEIKAVLEPLGYEVTIADITGATATESSSANGASLKIEKEGASAPALYVCEAVSDLDISSDVLTIRRLNWTISGFYKMTVQDILDSLSKGITTTLTVYESDMETSALPESEAKSGMMLKVEDITGEFVWYELADAIWRVDDPYYYFARNPETNTIESLTAICEADMYVNGSDKTLSLAVAQYDKSTSSMKDINFTSVALNEKKVMSWGGGATGDGANNENALGGNYQITTTLDITQPVDENTYFKVLVFENMLSVKPLKNPRIVYPESTSLAGKTLVSFGDSITGNALYGYPHLVAENTGMDYLNVGIGGACMMYQEKDGEKALSMVNVVDLLNGTSDDWSAADEYILTKLGIDSFESASAGIKRNARYVHYYENMKNLDLSKVDIVTLAFGTNDWSGDPELIDNSTKAPDKTSFGGSVRYVIEGLKKANPDLKIVFLTPIYRGRELENESNSDNANAIYNYSGGNTLKEFAEKIKEVVNETEYEDVYVIDMYENSGINRYNAYTYLYDGLHPVYTTAADPNTRGLRMMASEVSCELTDFFAR